MDDEFVYIIIAQPSGGLPRAAHVCKSPSVADKIISALQEDRINDPRRVWVEYYVIRHYLEN